jgi:hypothetical protein
MTRNLYVTGHLGNMSFLKSVCISENVKAIEKIYELLLYYFAQSKGTPSYQKFRTSYSY